MPSPLAQAPASTFSGVRFVLTDMDETLTYRGRLAADTYRALERLQNSGVVVIPVTAAPAGWADQMARMWPVDGVIAENGGLFFQGARRWGWQGEDEMAALKARLDEIGRAVLRAVPAAAYADDQPFRLTSLAFTRPVDSAQRRDIVDALRAAGLRTTLNDMWVLGWLGDYDKLVAARRYLDQAHSLDIDADPDAVLYCGDSLNDAPMFGFFRHTVGVSTVRQYLDQMPTPPRWVADGPGGAGFVEAADAVIKARRTA
jgi:HAD superfamily hydrolase (TIGR01484 family)